MSQQNWKQQKPMETEEDESDSILVEEIVCAGLEQQKQQQPHRRLPLELECDIFKCLKQPIQCKFILGMGRGIYRIFGHKLLTKCKRLRNPKGNFMNKFKTKATLSPDGLKACNTFHQSHESVFCRKGFAIAPKYARHDHFPGTIIYYFEVTRRSFSSTDGYFFIGLTNGCIRGAQFIGKKPNSYALAYDYQTFCWIADEVHSFEWPGNENLPAFNGRGDVLGCGLLMNPENSVTIFFTLNGTLLDKPIPISPSVGCLWPTVKMVNASLELNFGDNLAKPFKFDVNKCPGLVFQ